MILATIDVTVKKSAFGLFVSISPSQAVFTSGEVNAKDVKAGTVVKFANLDVGYKGFLVDGINLEPSITPPFIKSLAKIFLEDSLAFSYLDRKSTRLNSSHA